MGERSNRKQGPRHVADSNYIDPLEFQGAAAEAEKNRRSTYRTNNVNSTYSGASAKTGAPILRHCREYTVNYLDDVQGSSFFIIY